MKVTRVSNAGILVERDGHRILIDGLNISNIYHYVGTVPEEFDVLMASEDVDYLVFTHVHDDHFNAIMTMKYMDAHPKTKVVAPVSVLEKLLLCGIAKDRMIDAASIPFGTDFPVNAFRTIHIGTPYKDVLHYSYYLGGEETLLYTGDAIPLSSNYKELEETGVHISVLASNYAHVIGAGIRTIRRIIHPEHTLVLHLPDPHYDEEGLYPLTHDSIEHNPDLDIHVMDLDEQVTL